MGELVFIGLGLHEEKGLSLRAMEEARSCDELFAEFYTSALLGTQVVRLEGVIGKPVRVLDRKEVESGDVLLRKASLRRVGFLVAGDPMMATTHVDLRLRAAELGIPTRIVHGSSIFTAAVGLLGLQAYKFGRTTTIPIPDARFRPTSPAEAIAENRRGGLHTLVLLDLREDGTFLTANEALRYLLEIGGDAFPPDTLVCAIGRAGSPEPIVRADRADRLVDAELGDPLHCLVVPGGLHFMERRALQRFAKAPEDALPPE